MKKIILTLIISIVFIFGLVACVKTQEAKPTEGLEYTDMGDYYEVSGIGSATATDIVIPNEYNGKPVTSIGDFAFYGRSELMSVTIPDSVKSIGANAFYKTAYYNNESNWENGILYIGNHLISAKESISGDYSIKKGTILIAGEAFKNCSKLVNVTIPDSIITIGAAAFRDCSGLTSIIIPDSVINIEYFAFYKCSNLVSVTIPESVTTIERGTFYECSGLTSINIPQKVTSIDDYAFAYCSNLISVTIPSSLTRIGEDAFQDCKKINAVHITDIAKWCEISFGNNPLRYGGNLYINNELVTNLVIPDGVTSIGSCAFYGSGITSVNIPDSVTSIGSCAFYCSGLTSIIIPESVTSIGDYAFYKCSNLVSATIPASVTTIERGTFYECSGLTSINIPQKVTSIDDYAFAYCSNLKSVTIPSSLTSIGEGAFQDCKKINAVHITDIAKWCEISFGSNPLRYGGNLYINDELVTNLVIPDGVTSIGSSAFYGSGITSINIPQKVTSIGDYAFACCSNLKSVTIPSSLTRIGENAFQDCEKINAVHITDIAKWCKISFGSNPLRYGGNLYINDELVTNLVIPDGVTSIGSSAFYGSGLISITIPDSVRSIGIYAFSICKNLTIYCEAESQPSDWDSSWNPDKCPVVWGYKGEN